jgi:tRNA threonylcarbamoyladenosine biosynthesis protein TsaB
MRVLGIDTATAYGVLGLSEDGEPRGDVRFRIRPGGGERLPRTVQDLLRGVSWQPRDLDLIAVGTGPGSYTGIRVGIAFARSLAFGLNCPMLGITTHRIIGEYGAFFPGTVVVLSDARRGEVYRTLMKFRPYKDIAGPEPVTISALSEELNRRGEQVLLLGDGARVYRQQLESGLIVDAIWGRIFEEVPNGLHLTHLATERWSSSPLDESETCAPQYLRRVEAEIRLGERRTKQT